MKPTHSIQTLITLFFGLFISCGIYAQYTLNGPSSPGSGEVHTYTVSGSDIASVAWKILQPSGGGHYYVSKNITNAEIYFAEFNSPTIVAIVSDSFNNSYFLNLSVTVVASAPSTPGNPTISSNQCDAATLQRSGAPHPSSDIVWYWQAKISSGTSTTKGSGPTYTANEGSGTYYIRAKNTRTNLWSSSSGSIGVTINSFSVGSVTLAGAVGNTKEICYNTNPGTLQGSATGGDSYVYQWEVATSAVGPWSEVLNANNTSLNPGNLTATKYYRLKVVSCGQTKYSGNAMKVVVNPDLTAGSITGIPPVCYNGDPGVLGSSADAGGGDGSYSYQWQFSDNNSTWSDINGATASTYNPPSGLLADRWYKRRVISCGQTKYTSTVKVTVNPPLTSGSITGIPPVCYNGDPGVLGSSADAGGGNGSYSYQWQFSDNNSTWSDITGATASTYNPPSGLLADRWYQRQVTSCGQTKVTSTVKVTVNPPLTSGSISGIPPVCYNGDPGVLGSSADAGGGDGNYSYQWQYSDNNSIWSDIDGATASTYNPPSGLLADRWYKRQVISCGQTQITATVKVTVYPSLNPGTIGGTQTICSTEDPDVLTSVASASDGNGSYTYQWEVSDDNIIWNSIQGATGSSYDPPAGMSNSKWYKRMASSCGQVMASNVVKITVNQALQWYADTDADGYGDPNIVLSSCTTPTNYVSNNADLNDTNPLITNIPPQYFYDDTDGDGFGDPAISVYQSSAPANYVANNQDLCPWEYGTNNGCDYQPATLSAGRSYIYTRSYQKALSNSSEILSNRDIIESVAYFDGLGRLLQSNAIKSTPDKGDLLTHVEYDAFGRQSKTYLPSPIAAGNLGAYRTDALRTTEIYYNTPEFDNTQNPYAIKQLEASPLSRVQKQGAPGNDWAIAISGNDNSIEFDYQANTLIDSVRYYYVSFGGDGKPVLSVNGTNPFYGPGKLLKNITRDENHPGTATLLHTTEEFTNASGQVVLKRTYAIVDSVEEAHDTYYIYDDYGNLTYVLPPKVTTANGVDATELSELCYQYVYDLRNRLVEKKLPGKEWEYIVYNALDQPIMTQDANLRALGKWLATKYDAFGRVAFTGLVSGGTLTAEQNAANVAAQAYVSSGSSTIDGKTVYYPNQGYPANTAFTELLTINYYDTYTDPEGLSVPATIYGVPKSSNTKGLATVSKVRVLESGHWINTITGYDAKGRVIYTASQNSFLGTTDVTEVELDFVGKVLRSKTTHTRGANPAVVTEDVFTYDAMGRLLVQTQTLNGQTEEIVSNTYDPLGQLTSKEVGGGLQTVDYQYNVRGWLKKINDPANLGSDLFAFGINYNTPNHGGIALFNGNIAETEWKTANDNMLRFYLYTYDALNRIKVAGYNNAANTEPGWFNVANINYDKNGNLLTLNRAKKGTTAAGAAMDYLSYTYDAGNKLLKVEEQYDGAGSFEDGTNSGNDYTYDNNGNLTSDLNKGIAAGGIEYNHLNLPTQVSLNGGIITYTYDATGNKLQKTVSGGGGTTDYAGNYIYENGALQFMNHPEGYLNMNTGGNPEYVYQYKDHLGNIRVSYMNPGGSYKSLVNSDFNSNLDGWLPNGGATLSLDNGRLKADIDAAWEGVKHEFPEFVTTAGEILEVRVSFDKGNTLSKVRLYLHEVDSGGNLVAWNVQTYDLQSGNHVFNHTMANTGNRILLRIDKENTNTTSNTFFYIDHISMSQGQLEIVEENNYYPFGLQHKGYNSIVSSSGNSVAQRWKFGGKELDESLDLDTYDFGARNYDPALGRWMNIDPKAEKYYDKSSYVYSLNNPIFFVDPDGQEVDVTELLRKGGKNETYLLINLMANLSEVSGQKITLNTDNNGKSTLMSEGCGDSGNCSDKGSAYVDHLLGSEDVIKVNSTNNGTATTREGGIDYVLLDAEQIYGQQKALENSGVDSRTNSVGMVFLHESLHTVTGANYFNSEEDNREKTGRVFRDPSGNNAATQTGPVVDRINAIRNDMNLPTRYIYGNATTPTLYYEVDGNKKQIKYTKQAVPDL